MDRISALRQERGALALRLAEIDRALSDYDDLENRVAMLLEPHPDQPVQLIAPVEAAPGKGAAVAVPALKRSPMSMFVEVTRHILAEAPQPLNRTDLLERIEQSGVVVGGADARATLSTRLSRIDDVTNIAGHGYWLKHRPYKAANYVGETDDVDPSRMFG
jgi:hypothetical protein